MQSTFKIQTTVKKSGWEKHKRTGVNCRCWILLKECGGFQCVQTKLMWWKHEEEKKTLNLFEAASGVTAEENQKGEKSSLCEDCRSLRLHHTAVAKNSTQKKSRLDRRHKTEERGQKKSKLRHTTQKKIEMTSERQKKKTWTIKRCWREIQRRDGLNDCNVPETLVWPFFIYLFIFLPPLLLFAQSAGAPQNKKNLKAHKQKVKGSFISILCLGVCVNKDEALNKKCED